MNRLTGFFGGGKKSTNEDGMGPEKTDLAVGGENFGGGDFGGPGSMAAPRVGGAAEELQRQHARAHGDAHARRRARMDIQMEHSK